MILASVGTQLPFDRLIRAVDGWAESNQRTDVIGQIGPSRYKPRAIQCFPFLEHDRFFALQSQCRVMVSHAGMGSIITALEMGKPIIILARDHRRGEHRNGHQLATIGQFRNFPGVYAAADEDEVVALLDRCDTLHAEPAPQSAAAPEFIARLAAYVEAPAAPTRWQRWRTGARSQR